jgi:crotonobetainyl-CoA:carnitine CoA-transferase CaiB-like acyl-CoA transferase
MSDAESPLVDLKVLDLSRVMAGPYAGRLLSDMGADVVKLEPPEGDITRDWGELREGLSGFYTQQNAGKRNLCVDFKAEGGAELVRRLAARADIVIENFRPGVMARAGLGYEALAAQNPRLVMLSVSGFGQDGPESQRSAYAPVIHAEAGYIARHAQMDQNAPSDPIFSLADSYAALHGLVALLTALHMRERTGLGQHIDLNMLRALVSTDDYTHHLLDDALPPERLGGQVFEAPGGPILISATWKGLWHQAKTLYGVQADDGSSFDEKLANRRRALRAWVSGYQDRDLLKRDLDGAGLPWGDVRRMDEVLASPTLLHATPYDEVDDRNGGLRKVVRAPYRFSNASTGVRGPAPHRGEHNAEVLRDWLDLSQGELDTLAESGVLLSDGRAEAGASRVS